MMSINEINVVTYEGYSNLNPLGYWSVSTEGDVEGRSTKHLGIFYGYIDSLALYLADMSFYKLNFSKIYIPDLRDLNHQGPSPFCIKNAEVDVQLDIKSGTWDLNNEERVAYFQKLLRDRTVEVESSKYYASVKIKSERIKSEKDKVYEKLDEKFSKEEIDLLREMFKEE